MFRYRDRALRPLIAIHQVGHVSYRDYARALWIRDKTVSRCEAPYAVAVSSPVRVAVAIPGF